MCEATLKSPWVRYVGRVEALFSGDPEVRVSYDEEANVLKLMVDGEDKAEAIQELLPTTKVFGNVQLAIEVIPSNGEWTEEETFRKAFAGNVAFVDVAEGYGPAQDISYALFMPEVVQLEEDNVSQFDGVTTITFADLARSVLEDTNTLISSALL